MDRHHLLTLLDNLREKYEIQDGEYKEFAEAIGGTKKPIEITENDLVIVEYDHIETQANFDGDVMVPVIHVTEKCSSIWKVVADTNNFHVSSRRDTGWTISCEYLKRSEINISVIKHMAKNISEDLFTICTIDNHHTQHCIRVKSIRVI
jgi:hypothetical protein